QYGRIIIYGGAGITGIQVQPDVAVLDVNTTPYAWKAITDKTSQLLVYHFATLCGIYMIVTF
ncbi:1921_t:CDS:1, partial [Gigaspora margarita]